MTIKINCTGCKESFNVERTDEIPNEVKSLVCNWCPSCIDDADEEYQEKYIYHNT